MFQFREDLSKDYYVQANWALYCDNYLEGFHIPFIHNDLNAVLDFDSYDVETFKYSNLQIGIASDNEICFDYFCVINFWKYFVRYLIYKYEFIVIKHRHIVYLIV